MSAAVENSLALGKDLDMGRVKLLTVRITGAASTANAGLGSILNPFGEDVVVLRGTLYVVTESTGAAAVSIGITTAAAAATDILNALDLNGVGGDVFNCFAMQNTAKTEITAPAVWTAEKYLTITGAATTVGLDAILMLEVARLE